MSGKTNLVVVLAVLAFVCGLAQSSASADGLIVTPANPTIAVRETKQFTATATATAVAAAVGFHTCALLADGAVHCWGLNDSGQIGDGTTTSASNPKAAAGITGAVAVTGGGFHTCARFPTGT